MIRKKNPPAFFTYPARIFKFKKQGEKTGWTYVEVPQDVADAINPGVRKSYRVKGRIDSHPIKGVSLLPMGDGGFIIPLNAGMRKAICKREGAMVVLALEVDHEVPRMNADLMTCLADEPEALGQFKSMPMSHRNYFSKWIDSAKTPATRAKRIAMTVNAMLKKMNYAEMLRAGRSKQ